MTHGLFPAVMHAVLNTADFTDFSMLTPNWKAENMLTNVWLELDLKHFYRCLPMQNSPALHCYAVARVLQVKIVWEMFNGIAGYLGCFADVVKSEENFWLLARTKVLLIKIQYLILYFTNILKFELYIYKAYCSQAFNTETAPKWIILTRQTLTLHHQWVYESYYPLRTSSSLLLMHRQSSDLDRNKWKRSIFISCKDDGNRSGMKFCIAIVETTFKRLFIAVYTVRRQSAFNLQARRKQIN